MSPYRHAVVSDVPIPAQERKHGRKVGDATWRYPYDKMGVGQSFFVSAEELGMTGSSKLAASISQANRFYSARFVWQSRYPDETGEHGIRVWRTR